MERTHPRELPEWRIRLIEHTSSEMFLHQMAHAINSGKSALFPTVSGAEQYSIGAIAAQLLTRLELARLAEARLYYATADMTALALAAASTPPAELVKENRLPSPSGLMVFEQPIGGYVQDVATALDGAGTLEPVPHGPDGGALVTTPIVAVSWSPWSPEAIVLEDAPRGMRVSWWHQGQDEVIPVARSFRGVWLTFYTTTEDRFGLLDPTTPLARNTRDGTVITAGDLTAWKSHATAGLAWDNETALAYGVPFGEAEVDSTAEWSQVVYTAWQLITQTSGKRPITDTEELPRNRAGRKRDDRHGVADGRLHVVDVHAPIRPPRSAADAAAAASSGRRAPQWSCRWPVPPYRRNTCLNPRRHQAGECEHEEQIVGFHIKGPADKPLRIGGNTVQVWSHQPDDEPAGTGEQ